MRALWKLCHATVAIVCLGLLAGCTADPTPKKTAATDPAPKRASDDDPLAHQARQLRRVPPTGQAPDFRTNREILKTIWDITNKKRFKTAQTGKLPMPLARS